MTKARRVIDGLCYLWAKISIPKKAKNGVPLLEKRWHSMTNTITIGGDMRVTSWRDKKNLRFTTKAKTKAYEKKYYYYSVLFLFQKFLYLVREDDVFLEGISIGLGRANHADDFGVALTRSSLKCCNNFLCHRSLSPLLFDFFVNGHFLQVRIVLLELQTLRGIFLVLGGDVTAHAGDTAVFLLGALEDNLHSCVFIFLCHVL